MRVTAIALILLVVALVIFVLGDGGNSWVPGSLINGQSALPRFAKRLAPLKCRSSSR